MFMDVWDECDVDQSSTTSGTPPPPRWPILFVTDLFTAVKLKLSDLIYEKINKAVFLEQMDREVNARKSSWNLSSGFIMRDCATGAGASFV